ncbi:protein NEDD1 [Sesamum angolense]|uniref:Protein NEDD1 n=1 Tax=Sesamum angolense TaxID=2727404 RepID=A0AAE1X123_9LAMI|nr:protein NEDD1 [Sesamum angolense]
MNSLESVKLLLAAAGGDTVKLFDISVEPQNPCVLTYSPSPGVRLNSVKWNHNNLVLATAGEDCKISLWRKNGQSLWTVPAKNARGETVELTALPERGSGVQTRGSKDNLPSEAISMISFSNKGSRYLCSGGTGQVVRIWDLQNKRCVKWLKGHTDTITGVMYNCKDEHIASVSRKGDVILHNLASGTRAAELRDPNGQVLGALDYSRMSRHLLVTAGDDGSINLWDTTGRSPKVSWLKQHSAPTSGVSFSPSNDKIIASVGLDMKLYTFDTGSRKPYSCIPYEAPFSSLAFTDDGLTLAAGTSSGQIVFYDVRGKPQPITVLRAYGNSEAVTNLCWQRSKPVTVNENNCTDETVLLAGDAGDSILMPDPLPSRSSSSLALPTAASGSRNLSHSAVSGDMFSTSAGRLHAPRSYNFKDDMEVFSPLVEVQPITPTLDKLWDNHDGSKKDLDRKPSFLFSSRRFGSSEDGAIDNHPVSDWKPNSASKQDDVHSTLSPLTSILTSTRSDDSSSTTPPEAWGGHRLLDKFIHQRQSINMPSRFAMMTSSSSSSGLMSSALLDSLPTSQNTSSLASGLSQINLRGKENSIQEISLGSSEAVVSPSVTKSISGQANLDTLGPALSLPRRFSSYAERIAATPSLRTSALTTTNGGATQLQNSLSQPDSQQGASFTLQLFQRTLEETLASFQKSIHDDMRNLHIEILRQFHLQEMEMSSVMRLILENQAEIMKEIQSLQKKHASFASYCEHGWILSSRFIH